MSHPLIGRGFLLCSQRFIVTAKHSETVSNYAKYLEECYFIAERKTYSLTSEATYNRKYDVYTKVGDSSPCLCSRNKKSLGFSQEIKI